MFTLFGSDSENENKKKKQQQSQQQNNHENLFNKINKKQYKLDQQKQLKKQKEQPIKKFEELKREKEYLIKSSIGSEEEKVYILGDLLKKIYREDKYDKEVQIEKFEQENDEGTVEYKLQLVQISEERLQSLISQMKYRNSEGQGECFYKIGLEDCGTPLGLNEKDMEESMINIIKMSESLNLEVVITGVKQGYVGLIGELVIRKKEREEMKMVKMMMMGQERSGKSTVIGVMLSGENDDGEGSARIHVLSHKHELLSGQTSSMSQHLLGFDSHGHSVPNHTPLSYSYSHSSQHIVDKAHSLVQILDIGGGNPNKQNQMFVQSLLQQHPHYIILLLNNKIDKFLLDQINLVRLINIPIIVLISHQDLLPPSLVNSILIQLDSIFPSTTHIHSLSQISSFSQIQSSTPIFLISCKTGFNIELFQNYLSQLSKQMIQDTSRIIQGGEFLITNKFEVKNKIIVGGVMSSGVLKKYQKVLLGPNQQGLFQSVSIESIECNRVRVEKVYGSQNCTIVLRPGKAISYEMKEKSGELIIRKGMVLVDPALNPKAISEFTLQLDFYDSSLSSLYPYSYQPVLYSQLIKQTCLILRNNHKLKKNKSKSIDSKKIQNITPTLTHKSRLYSHHQNHNIRFVKTLFFQQNPIKQSTKLRKISKNVDQNPDHFFTLYQKTDDQNENLLRMRFLYCPEYIKVGQKIIISDENLRAIGTIKEIIN